MKSSKFASPAIGLAVGIVSLVVVAFFAFRGQSEINRPYRLVYDDGVLRPQLVQKAWQTSKIDMINQAIEETTIRPDCLLEETLHSGVIPSFPQEPAPQVGVFRRWFTKDGHEPCGFVAVYNYYNTGDTHLMWRHIVGYMMLDPEQYDDFLGDDDLALAQERTVCDLDGRCLAARASASQDLLIVVQTFADNGDDAEALCTLFVSGVATNLGNLTRAAK